VEEGLSYRQCIECLKIPERTFKRYVADIFKHDNEVLASRFSDDQIFTEFNICIERLTKLRQEVLDGIANNENADWKARVEAHHLAATISAVIAKTYVDAHSLIAHRHRFPVSSITNMPITNMPTARSNNTGVALRLQEIRDPATGDLLRHEQLSEQEEDDYDELDDPEQQQEQEEEASIT
jgi:hypothetical protein